MSGLYPNMNNLNESDIYSRIETSNSIWKIKIKNESKLIHSSKDMIPKCFKTHTRKEGYAGSAHAK